MVASIRSQFFFDFDEILHSRLGPETKNEFVAVQSQFSSVQLRFSVCTGRRVWLPCDWLSMHLCTVLLLLHLFSYCILNWYSAIRLYSRKCEIKLSSVQFSSVQFRVRRPLPYFVFCLNFSLPRLRWRGIFNDNFTAKFLESVTVKEYWKSVWWSYNKNLVAYFFDSQCTCTNWCPKIQCNMCRVDVGTNSQQH